MTFEGTIKDLLRDLVREEVDRRVGAIRRPDRDVALTTEQCAELTGLARGTLLVGRCRNNHPDKYKSVDVPPHRKIGARVVYMKGEVLDWLEDRREVAR